MSDTSTPSERERAFFAMIEYLDAYWQRGDSPVSDILSGMQFVPDGRTADAACWEDWEEAWRKSEGKTKSDYRLFGRR